MYSNLLYFLGNCTEIVPVLIEGYNCNLNFIDLSPLLSEFQTKGCTFRVDSKRVCMIRKNNSLFFVEIVSH